jgi:hypothetical protein
MEVRYAGCSVKKQIAPPIWSRLFVSMFTRRNTRRDQSDLQGGKECLELRKTKCFSKFIGHGMTLPFSRFG